MGYRCQNEKKRKEENKSRVSEERLLFKKGFLEAGKEIVALGAGELLHWGQCSWSVGGSGRKGLCFFFPGMTGVDSAALHSRKNRVWGSGVKGWQDPKETRCYFPQDHPMPG